MRYLKTNALALLAALIFLSACSATQKNAGEPVKKYIPVSPELYDTIVHMDSVLFDAFNKRDLEKLKTVFSTDIEFFHDKGGLTDYNQVIANSQKLFDQNNDLKRTPVPGSVEVYPIKDYGAVQTGMHRFCHLEKGKEDCGTFKFVHVWRKKDGQWKLARVISYDH